MLFLIKGVWIHTPEYRCITVCWIWGCIAVDHSGCPRWPMSTTDSTNHVLSCLPGKHLVPQCTFGKRQAADPVILFCWKIIAPAIHVGITLICTTYLRIVFADHVPLSWKRFPEFFSNIIHNVIKQKRIMNGLWSSIQSVRLWHVFGQTSPVHGGPTSQLLRLERRFSNILMFWQWKRDQNNIQWVIILFCLICVFLGVPLSVQWSYFFFVFVLLKS